MSCLCLVLQLLYFEERQVLDRRSGFLHTSSADLRAQPRITSHFGLPIHPAWLRCSSVKYQDILHSSRLARRAPRHPKKGTYFWLGPKRERPAAILHLDLAALSPAHRTSALRTRIEDARRQTEHQNPVCRLEGAEETVLFAHKMPLIQPPMSAEVEEHSPTGQSHEAERHRVAEGKVQLRHGHEVHAPDPRQKRGRIEDRR